MNTANAFISGVLAMLACLGPLARQAAPGKQPLNVAWQTEVVVEGVRHVTVGQHSVIVTGSLSGVSAHALDDGRILWQRPTVASGQPVAVGSVFVLVADGALQALDQASGQDVWRAALDGTEPLSSLRLAAINRLVFAIRGAAIHAWRPDGTLAWQRALPSALVTEVVRSGDLLLAGLQQSEILALDPATGATRWTARLGAVPTALTLSDDQVFVPTTNGDLLAFRVAGAGLKRMWRHRDRAVAAVGAPAVSGRRVFYALMDNTVKAFGRTGGSKLWTAPLASRAVTGPILLGDDLVVPMASGELAQVTADSGKAPPKPADSKPTPVRLGAIAIASGSLYAIVTAGNEVTTLMAWRAPR